MEKIQEYIDKLEEQKSNCSRSSEWQTIWFQISVAKDILKYLKQAQW